jgi:hypothetical protein
MILPVIEAVVQQLVIYDNDNECEFNDIGLVACSSMTGNFHRV